MRVANYRVQRSAYLNRKGASPQLSVAILDVGDAQELVQTLAWYHEHFNYCLFVVTRADQWDLDALMEQFPTVSYIIFERYATYGERVNAVANECGTNHFLISRSDVLLINFDGKRLFNAEKERVAVASSIANVHRELVPTIRTPAFIDTRIDPLSSFPAQTKAYERTLYPVMGLALYDRALFQRIRGFDTAITSEYYQLLDWGIRAAMMGYSVLSSDALLMQFSERESVIEDRTDRPGYLRAYTKALGFKKTKSGSITPKRPPRKYFDREAWKIEVKQRIAHLIQYEYHALIASWNEEQ